MRTLSVFLISSLLLLSGLTPGPGALRADAAGPHTSAADQPAASQTPRTYAIEGKPSELLDRRTDLLVLAGQVEQDLQSELDRAATGDPRLRRGASSSLFQIAVLRRDADAARRALAQVRAALDEPVSRSMAGLIGEPYVVARTTSGTDFPATFRALMAARLAALDFQEVHFTLNALSAQLKGLSAATVRRLVETTIDTEVRDGRIERGVAERLLAIAANWEVVGAVKDDLLACLAELFERHKGEATPYAPKIGTPPAPIRGAYFDQPRPGPKPQRFAPAVLDAISKWVVGLAFSAAGDECFLTVGGPAYGGSRIFTATMVDGTWTPFATPQALEGYILTGEAHFSADGHTLYFTGKRPGEPQRIWTMRREGAQWGRPALLPGAVNAEGDAYRGKRTADGTWYFGRNLGGMMQIYRTKEAAAGDAPAVKLDAPVNNNTFDGDPCIAPDGRWLVFNSGRAGSHGGSDLYVSVADGQGGWGTPVNLGPDFNSPYDEYGAHLSPDGKYLFFTRHAPTGAEIHWLDASALDAAGSRRRPEHAPHESAGIDGRQAGSIW